MNIQHVVPVNDQVDHDTSAESGEDCICGPDTEEVHGDYHIVIGKVVIHHSLDGRELNE